MTMSNAAAPGAAEPAAGWSPELEEIERRRARALLMGGTEKVARQHKAGKLTVRERITSLLDDGSFAEVGSVTGFVDPDTGEFSPANTVAGTGRVDGRKIVVCGDDFTVRGGAADAAMLPKQIYAEALAQSLQVPMVRLVDGTGGGGSVKVLEQQGHTYVPVNPGWDHVVENLSLVPVVSACLGSVAGLGAARTVAAHLSVMVEGTAQLFVAGPPVVRFGTGEELTKEELGGADVHRASGAIDRVVDSEAEAFRTIQTFLGYLPPNVYGTPPVTGWEAPDAGLREALATIIPRNRRRPYKLFDLTAGIF
jgi:acetyl-CoA carboxylase carboxyltransferase component